MFPNGICHDGKEVNHLTKGTVPVGDILISGQSNILDIHSRREYYAVELDGYVAFLRVCDAYPDSGYDEFAVIHCIVSKEDTEEVQSIIDRITVLIK